VFAVIALNKLLFVGNSMCGTMGVNNSTGCLVNSKVLCEINNRANVFSVIKVQGVSPLGSLES